jgi:glycosyltransferase involved in cell wall biosynthesis
LGISSRIHFVGGQEHRGLPDLLGAGDLFVQPTVGEEAFGISVVEAMACGLPVLASNVGGLPEVVADNESGYLLPPGEVEVWRQQIQKLRSETELRKKMGLAARLRVLAKFSWMQNGQRLVELIQNAKEPN